MLLSKSLARPSLLLADICDILAYVSQQQDTTSRVCSDHINRWYLSCVRKRHTTLWCVQYMRDVGPADH
jgi:hypothetical protein